MRLGDGVASMNDSGGFSISRARVLGRNDWLLPDSVVAIKRVLGTVRPEMARPIRDHDTRGGSRVADEGKTC